MHAEDYQSTFEMINGTPVNVITYKIGATYYCKIENRNPGATIVRTEGSSAVEVLANARSRAEKKLS